MYSFKAQHKIIWVLLLPVLFAWICYEAVPLVISFIKISPLLSILLAAIPILLFYILPIGIFYYPTSTVELHPKEVMLEKRRKKIIIPASDICSISYVTSRSTGKKIGAPVWVYYRLVYQSPSSKIKKIYFRDYVAKPPKASFGEWKQKIDRSEEFMTFIKTENII